MSRKKKGEVAWTFAQSFGENTDVEKKEPHEADIISALEFDRTGEFLAIGDRGGRIVILERAKKQSTKKKKSQNEMYRIMTEFQSHEPEFDYLKSLEIEEKINSVRWFPPNNGDLFLLSTNDKTIKFWKVAKRKQRKFIPQKYVPGGKLKLPAVQDTKDSPYRAVLKRQYASVHSYHINSIDINTDHESFLSADDLRINLWNISHKNCYHNIIDIKPENIEDLTEVITSASFHPVSCNLFMYSSSKGIVKLCDLRESVACNSYIREFHVEEDPKDKTFFSEIIASISDSKFSLDGRFILQRDYMTVKIWDMNMNSRPVSVFNIHEALRPKLCDLYENDCIFDKFECNWSGDGKHVVTGSYKNYFFTINTENGKQVNQECVKKAKKRWRKKRDLHFEVSDFPKKCLHCAWHPTEDTVAVAAVSNLYIYTWNHGKKKK